MCQTLILCYGALQSVFKDLHVIISIGCVCTTAKKALIVLFFVKMRLNMEDSMAVKGNILDFLTQI